VARSQQMGSVLSALRVLEELAPTQPAGVGQLARTLGVPKSSVQRALLTLHAAGWIRPAGGELTRWVLTTRPLRVSRHIGAELNLREVALPVMEALRRRTQETIHLMVLEDDRAVLVERLETSNPVRVVIPLGSSAPMHGSSNGKSILAHSSPAELERLLPDPLPRYTDATVTDRESLLDELRETRERGYAINMGEWRSDIAAVAAAILDQVGHPVASLSVSMPASRMARSRIPEYGRLVHEAALEIAEALNET
jgi:IclR family transcriptional regulator, acetate operon repressor